MSPRDDQYTCEASIGIDASGPGLLILMCRKPAKLYDGPLRPFQTALCEEHKDLQYGQRNQ